MQGYSHRWRVPGGGFIDDLMLLLDIRRWPCVGWRRSSRCGGVDERKQVLLQPVNPAFLRENLEQWLAERRPDWGTERGRRAPRKVTAIAGGPAVMAP
jgi:hypothetical protein